MRKLILTASILIACSGCASQTVSKGDLRPPPDMDDPTTVAALTFESRDDFKKVKKYEGPNLRPGNLDQVMLRAYKVEATKTTLYQIYVNDFYNGQWRFYSTADDEHGNPVPFQLLDRKVIDCYSGCSHTETVALNVDRSYLERYQESGIRIKISGKAGEVMVRMPGPVIKGFLNAVDTK